MAKNHITLAKLPYTPERAVSPATSEYSTVDYPDLEKLLERRKRLKAALRDVLPGHYGEKVIQGQLETVEREINAIRESKREQS